MYTYICIHIYKFGTCMNTCIDAHTCVHKGIIYLYYVHIHTRAKSHTTNNTRTNKLFSYVH